MLGRKEAEEIIEKCMNQYEEIAANIVWNEKANEEKKETKWLLKKYFLI